MTQEERDALHQEYLQVCRLLGSGIANAKHGDKGVAYRPAPELRRRKYELEDQLGLPSTRPKNRRTNLGHVRIGATR